MSPPSGGVSRLFRLPPGNDIFEQRNPSGLKKRVYRKNVVRKEKRPSVRPAPRTGRGGGGGGGEKKRPKKKKKRRGAAAKTMTGKVFQSEFGGKGAKGGTGKAGSRRGGAGGSKTGDLGPGRVHGREGANSKTKKKTKKGSLVGTENDLKGGSSIRPNEPGTEWEKGEKGDAKKKVGGKKIDENRARRTASIQDIRGKN